MNILLTFLLMLPVLCAGPAGVQDSDRGDSVPTRARLALRELSQRASQGDGESLYRLAYVHDIGYDSIPADTAESTRLYRLAAEAGHNAARNYLGFRLIRGEGIEKNPGEGLMWIEKAALAGDPKAANNLGVLLTEGKYVEKDREKALYWFGKAADAGLPSAMAQLADLLSEKEAPDADFPLAARLYVIAAEKGLPDARAKLAAMLNRTAPSLPEAAALLKEKALLADVYRTLADSYSLALGLPYSYEQSLRDYYIASLLGDEQSRDAIDELIGLLPDALDGIDREKVESETAEALSILSNIQASEAENNQDES